MKKLSYRIFSFSPIWSPAAPVRCVDCSGAASQKWLSGCQQRRGCWRAASQVVPCVHFLCDGHVGVFYAVSLNWYLQSRGVSSPVLFTYDFLHTSSACSLRLEHGITLTVLVQLFDVAKDVLVTEERETLGQCIYLLSQAFPGVWPVILSDVWKK